MLEAAQDATWTITLSPPEDVTNWLVTATIRAYNGGPVLVTKSGPSSDIQVTNTGAGVFVVYFTATDLTLSPGAYVLQLHRTNPGFGYPLTDPSPLIIRPADADAEQLVQCMAAAEDWIKRYCNRDFAYRANVTEYPTPNGTHVVLLNRTPVTPASVVVYEDYTGNFGQTSGAFDPVNSILTLGTDYTVPIDTQWNDGLNYSGRLIRLNRTWPYAQQRPMGLLAFTKVALPGSVKVVFTGGYSIIPYAIKNAVWNLTTLFARMAPEGRLAMSESGEGESVSWGNIEDIPWTVTRPLAPFRRFVI